MNEYIGRMWNRIFLAARAGDVPAGLSPAALYAFAKGSDRFATAAAADRGFKSQWRKDHGRL